jgi:FMN phosphatase YigB (HAD superfamily)
MIRVVLFDLGLTLVDSLNRPFPHVKEALQIMQSFTTAKGKPLHLGLVSDFDLPAPPATPAKVAAIFDRYLAVLDHTGLRPFFEPVQRRVTLSTHAGVLKPDRKIFETALRRLRSKASLEECLFVTENRDHIRAARTRLHMSTLHFRSGESSGFDFDDWLQAPPMIAHLVDPTGGSNAEAALRGHLSLSHGFDLHTIDRPKRARATAVRGTLWKPVGSSAGKELANVHAPFTVEGEVTRGPAGEIRGVRFAEPASTDVTEAAALVRSLARHGQIRGSAPQPAGAATHDIETDDRGRRKLVRKRFRAI